MHGYIEQLHLFKTYCLNFGSFFSVGWASVHKGKIKDRNHLRVFVTEKGILP